MRKRLLLLLAVGVLCLTGCQSAEEKQQAAMMEAFEQMGVEHNEVIMSVLSKEWKVLGGETTYEFTKEGTGNVSGATFTYSCDFNEENKIMLQITMDETKEELNYFVSADDTGHGLFFESVEGEKMQLLMSNVELLDTKDERVKAIIGEWADKSDNRYVFDEERNLVIKGSDSEKEGSYSVVLKDEVPLLTLVIGSNTLEFQFEFVDETIMDLCAPGTETVHTWIKK